MLVGINCHFKIPIAYYLITALYGKEKSTLAKEILTECYLHDIDVRNITFDGASSNISMVEDLGAEIYGNTSEAFFNDPTSKKPIYTSLDACHMLKLERNTLASSTITDEDNNEISWKYIKALVELQEKEGLHAATKIRRRHVEFENEKMKVNLAAQVLSRSSADALRYCEVDCDLEEFDGASATARYCEVFNDCFDILNSKNQFSKNPSKHAIHKNNVKDLKVKVDAYVKYIKNLKIDGKNILETNKRTAFLGFIISMKNAVKLAEDLFEEGQLLFLLTYKLSQDHLETFFSCIRRFGGWNNNPTTKQFKSAYRKLLSHVNISVPLSANSIPKDDTLLLNKTDEENSTSEVVNFESINSIIDIDIEVLEEICDAIPRLYLSEYTTDIIAYISGAVVKIIKKKIKCELCLKGLELGEKEEALSVLQRRKSYGNLISASEDVIVVCKTAEKILRLQESYYEKYLLEKLILKCLHGLQINSLFVKYEHIFELAPLSDHKIQLIKLILNQYFQIRLHHEACSKVKFETRVRTRNNKLTLFYNQ